MRLKQYFAIGGSVLTSGWLLSFVTGFACACGLAFGVTLAIGTVGFSAPVAAGLLIALALGIDTGRHFRHSTPERHRILNGLAFFAWLFLAAALADGSLGLVGATGLALSSIGAIVAGFALGLVAIALPTFLLFNATAGLPSRSAVVSGCSLGLIAAPFLLPLVGSAYILALGAAGVAAVFHVAHFFFGRTTSSGHVEPTTAAELPMLFRYSTLLTCGVAFTILARVLNQTILASMPVLFACGGALLFAAWLATANAPGVGRFSRWWNHARTPSVLLLASIASIAVSITCFPALVRLQLWLSATVQYATPIWLLRAAVATAFLAPVAMLTGACGFAARASEAGRTQWPAITFIVGACVASVVYAMLPTATLAVVCGGMMALSLVMGLKLQSGKWLPTHLAARSAVIVAVSMVVAAGLGRQQFEPEYASRLLFSSGVFQQYNAGTDTADLLAANESRLLASTESINGISSQWRVAGTRVQVRHDGLPSGLYSINTSVCPQPIMASLPVVLPLVLHDGPEDILLLGDVGPVAKATSLMFPLQSVMAIDEGLRSDSNLTSAFSLPTEDDRFSQVSADPAVAVAGLNRAFDIVISRPPHPTLVRSAPYYTSDFYGRAARLVGENGLFCQTFTQHDFGPDPLLRILKSLHVHFEHVSAAQLTPGEIMLVAKNGEQIVGKHIATRTNFAHVRRILGDMGWDWSRVLGLASLDTEAVNAILSTSTIDNTAANAAFAWGLPLEMMRWADKKTELRTQIGAYQRRILDQLPEHELRDEAARRLSEIGQESEILFGFPDEPWMYRKTLKTRLEQNPRPPIEVVRQGDVKREAHEVDKLRIEYFKTLANAIQTQDADAIKQLEQFVSPSEPLVSYFATHELARICAKRGDLPQEELKYRLRSTYFTPGATRSVREVVAAVDLLVENSQLVPNAADRWDQLNSLLQVLTVRWNARRNIAPSSSRVALNDIEKSLVAIDKGLSAMKEWQTEAGIDTVLCSNRERFLRTQLERPLRRYRDELMPHHYKAEAEMMAEEDDDQVIDQFRSLGN